MFSHTLNLIIINVLEYEKICTQLYPMLLLSIVELGPRAIVVMMPARMAKELPQVKYNFTKNERIVSLDHNI